MEKIKLKIQMQILEAKNENLEAIKSETENKMKVQN